jgi:hypothetical protein
VLERTRNVELETAWAFGPLAGLLELSRRRGLALKTAVDPRVEEGAPVGHRVVLADRHPKL